MFGGTQQAGLYRSAYHFAQPASSSGTAQANYFVGAVNAVGGFNDTSTYQLVLDLEDSQVRAAPLQRCTRSVSLGVSDAPACDLPFEVFDYSQAILVFSLLRARMVKFPLFFLVFLTRPRLSLNIPP